MVLHKARLFTLALGSIAVFGTLGGCVVSGPYGRGLSTCEEQQAVGRPCDGRRAAELVRGRGGKGDGSPGNDGLQNVGSVGGGGDAGTGDGGGDAGNGDDGGGDNL